MEAGVVAAVGAAQHAADDVLPGVLLHVVKAPGPVDDPVDCLPLGKGLVAGVEDDTLLLLDVRDPGAAQDAVVGRLAAALGVEGGLIQLYLPFFALGSAGQDLSVKFPLKGVGVV